MAVFLYNIPTVYVYYIMAFFIIFFHKIKTAKYSLIYTYIHVNNKKKKKNKSFRRN